MGTTRVPRKHGVRNRAKRSLERLTFEAKPPEALLDEVQSLLLLKRLALKRVRLAPHHHHRHPDVSPP